MAWQSGQFRRWFTDYIRKYKGAYTSTKVCCFVARFWDTATQIFLDDKGKKSGCKAAAAQQQLVERKDRLEQDKSRGMQSKHVKSPSAVKTCQACMSILAVHWVIYIYIYITYYIHIIRATPGLCRIGFPFPFSIKCCCNSTFNWEDQHPNSPTPIKLLHSLKIFNKGLILPPPQNFYIHWRSSTRV